MQSTQEIVLRLRSGGASVEEIRRLLHNNSNVVRANALEALVSHAQREEGLLGEIHAAVIDPENQARLMGTISIAHVAMACLLRVGNDSAMGSARDFIDSWPEPDRTDLLWYLTSEGLAAPCSGLGR